MTLIGKKLSRRTILRGLGTAVALPWLNAMQPAGRLLAAPAATASPTRLGFVYVPNGIVMEQFTPTTVGADFEFTSTLQPLAPFRDRTLVISGLMDHNANALGDGGGDHARAGASFLTGAHPKKTGGFDINVGISVDQVAAQAVGQQTRLPSLEVGLDDNRTTGHCDSGYSCAYTNSISWRAANVPNPPEANPRAVFERLFGARTIPADPAAAARQRRYRQSILDSTLEEARSLAGAVGPDDRRKLDEYLSSIREVERQIQHAEASQSGFQPTLARPSGIPAEFRQHAGLLFDLLALAFQSDQTRIMTCMIGREGSVRTYPEIGVPDPHHPLSHHRNRAEALAQLALINRYHMELFAGFITKLRNTPDGDGTLLDHSMILYGCGISDSNRHLHENLPVVVVGGGNNQLPGNRHIQLEKDTPISNLYLAMLQRMNAPTEKLGDSTGVLEI